MDSLLAQPLSCLRQRLSPSCGPERPRTLHAGLTIDRGKQHRWPLFFSTPFSFLFLCFFNLYPVFIFLMMLCRKPEKEKDGERPNHQYVEKEKNKCKREQRKKNTITVITLNVWKAGRPDQHLSKRRGEREGGEGRSNCQTCATPCVYCPSPTCFFSFCIYVYLCVFSTAGALEVITV